jgi:hypothetical protein
MIEDPKAWWQSKTVIASIIAVLAVIAGYFGYDIGGAEQAGLVETISAGVGVVASLLAAFFRITATAPIGKP